MTALNPSSSDAALHLLDRECGVLQRHQPHSHEAGRVIGAVLVQPAVVFMGHGVEHVGLGDPGQSRGGRVEHGHVDPVGVHVDQPRPGFRGTRPIHELGMG